MREGWYFLYFLLHCLHSCLICLFVFFCSSYFFPFLKMFSVFFIFCFMFLRVLVLCGFWFCAGFSSIWFLHFYFFCAFFFMSLAWTVGIAKTTTSWVWAECLFGWHNTWTGLQYVSVYKYLYLMMLNNPSQRRRGDKRAKN